MISEALKIITKSVGILAFLGGCTPQVEPDGTTDDPCNAAAFGYVKWQPAEILADLEIPEPHRIYNRSDAITQDFRKKRLNFVVGNTGRIEVIRCG
ncbi:MAG: hypothetical protein AAF198_04120 [Pseudomonadota bacterium]